MPFLLSRMNFQDKHDEVSKDDWIEKLQNHHCSRADMNKLIMNYLVTGNGPATYWKLLIRLNKDYVHVNVLVLFKTSFYALVICMDTMLYR